ncbi:hypothetical protein HanPI659440_Chr12g0469931 [Helianthus annuus]|nr:hypothetical protein HanPI659440_Chr12g0469931 [Helianthus annuus]
MSLIHGSELLKEAINFHRRLELEITIWTCENDDSDIRFQRALRLHFHSPTPFGFKAFPFSTSWWMIGGLHST